MKTKDVKNILDIPNIENYLEKVFELNLYDVGDKTIIYEYKKRNKHTITIDVISDEKLIIGKQDLASVIAHYKIVFLHWNETNDIGNDVSSFSYRPLIDEVDKNY